MASRWRLLLAPWLLSASALLALLAGCSGLGGPARITLTATELEALLARQFPLERRVTEVFDLSLSSPQLRLVPERNRIALMLDFDARERLLGGLWQGRLGFESLPRWDAAQRSVRLAEVKVVEFTLDRRGQGARSSADRLGGTLVERLLEGLTLYTLSTEHSRQLQVVGLEPSSVQVTSRGVEIAFERPVR